MDLLDLSWRLAIALAALVAASGWRPARWRTKEPDRLYPANFAVAKAQRERELLAEARLSGVDRMMARLEHARKSAWQKGQERPPEAIGKYFEWTRDGFEAASAKGFVCPRCGGPAWGTTANPNLRRCLDCGILRG